MYERHFGFSERPFNLTPDSRYLFLSPKHQEAYASLEFGVNERSGFLLLTGEVGTGKTTLIRHFLAQLGPEVRTAVILYPVLSAGEMFHAILQDLEVPFSGGSLKDAVDTLANALIGARAAGLKVVVLVDEAQNLRPHVLEQLRLLSNLETEREKLLTLILVGQPELRSLLEQKSLRQLSQRITSRSHLEPLSLDQTQSYVKHRLVVAGGNGLEFEDAALRQVHSLSGGVPRVVNVLCDRALVGAFGRGLKEIDAALVTLAATEVLSASTVSGVRLAGRFWEGLLPFSLGFILMLPLSYYVPLPVVRTPVGASLSLAQGAVPGTSETRSVRAPQSTEPSRRGISSRPSNIVRCGQPKDSRPAAVAAIEEFLGTPAFDSAQATLTFTQWRALGLPAIAPFHTANGPCEAAILPADRATTQLSDASGDYLMSNARLKESFLGTAIVCFVDRDRVLAKPEPARIAWARGLLERRSIVPPGASDATFSAALVRVGGTVGLKNAASIEGVLLAALYSIERGVPPRPGGPR